MEIPAKLHKVAENNGYRLEYRPRIYVRGWPADSKRPWHLQWADGSHLAAFSTLALLEKNLRARAGC